MPDFSLEDEFLGPVIGIDEAGRGPWAGPVSICAFWLNRSDPGNIPAGLDDSKKLSAARRAFLFDALVGGPHIYSLVHTSVEDIDRLGILKATLTGMALAADNLVSKLQQAGIGTAAQLLIDGNQLPTVDLPAQAVVKGDSRSLSIAAASIIAKQARDRIMLDLSQTHPGYGWDSNMGYGTKAHQAALAEYGITQHHRRSFAPIRRLVDTGGDANAS